MCKALWNKRGITPVLSSLLLMVIAVSVMSIAITATFVITNNLRETMGERFIVEDAWFKTSEIALYLYNTGKMPIKIVAVYINHASQPFTLLELAPNDHGWLNVTYSWAASSVYYINIATSKGIQVADSYKSPS